MIIDLHQIVETMNIDLHEIVETINIDLHQIAETMNIDLHGIVETMNIDLVTSHWCYMVQQKQNKTCQMFCLHCMIRSYEAEEGVKLNFNFQYLLHCVP